jgi:serine/threonine protein kinase
VTSAPLPPCKTCGWPAPPDEPCPYCGDAGDALRVGEVVGARYRIEALLGRGGFGAVYRATHLGLEIPVAVKFLHPEWAAKAEARQRFRREAELLTRLRHPGIVTAYDFGEHDGAPYIVMELAEGDPLVAQLLVDGRTMSIARAVAVVAGVLEVLEVAHHAGIVHRDLKPENVFTVDRDDGVHVRVLDFGLARAIDAHEQKRLTESSAVMGTPQYMSPEQCHGRDVGPASDVYSVGVMLFELLAGAPPFRGETSATLMVQQMFVEPPTIASVGVHAVIPEAIEAVVKSALAKRPEQRPDARSLREALLDAHAGRDGRSFTQALVDARIAAAGLTRSERALPLPDVHQRATDFELPTSTRTSIVDPAHAPRVLVVAKSAERADALRTALAVHGLAVDLAEPQDAPFDVPFDVMLARLANGAWPAIVIDGGLDAAPLLASVRANARTAETPVLVMGLASAEETAALIRAGASDVALAEVGDEVLSKRILRLVRRKR